MTVLHPQAQAAIALAPSLPIAGAVRRRTGHSGSIDTLWKFSRDPAGAAGAWRPVAGAATKGKKGVVT